MATPKKTTSSRSMTAKTKATLAKAKPSSLKGKADSFSLDKVLESNIFSSAATATSKSWLGWLVAVLLGGTLVGTYISDVFWMQAFDGDKGMLVVDDRTWMPVGGIPISVVVLNDKNCGTPCDASGSLNSLRASVNPALKISEIDISSAEGQALINDFDLVSVPQYFFGNDIEAFKVKNTDGEAVRFIDNLPASLLTKKNNLYYIDSAQVGFKPGKFIKPPEFADLATEPQRGNGPVKVVEFTDLQCPYCKRFYDQNKTLIEQLISENKITYIVKDFPLSFHTESYEVLHKAANCTLQAGGNEAYFAVKDQIFRNQSSFTNLGVPAAEQQVVDYASEQGVDIRSCLATNGNPLQTEIAADIAEGAKYGVSGTPTIFVGTQILPGAVGPAVLSVAVEAELGQ